MGRSKHEAGPRQAASRLGGTGGRGGREARSQMLATGYVNRAGTSSLRSKRKGKVKTEVFEGEKRKLALSKH